MNMLRRIKCLKNFKNKFFSQKNKFDFEDPLNFKSLLTQEESMVT